MTDFLKQLVMKRSDLSSLYILEIGCGTGYLTAKLSHHFQNATITAIDLAPGMIEIAQQRMVGKRIHFLCGDIEEMELYDRYDLIISNATFQWFNHLEHTLSHLSSILKREGVIFSTFGCGACHELHTFFNERCKNYNSTQMLASANPFTH